jgi:hypothetical protein
MQVIRNPRVGRTRGHFPIRELLPEMSLGGLTGEQRRNEVIYRIR